MKLKLFGSCFLIALLLLALPHAGIAADADELYDQAEQKYFNFDNEAAEDLLQEALRIDPDHERARELLLEIGGEIPEPKPAETTEPDTEAEAPASDTEPSSGSDTEPARADTAPESSTPSDTSTSPRTGRDGADTPTEPSRTAPSGDSVAPQKEINVADDDDGRPPALSGTPGSIEPVLPVEKPPEKPSRGGEKPSTEEEPSRRTILPALDMEPSEGSPDDSRLDTDISSPELILPKTTDDTQEPPLTSATQDNLNTAGQAAIGKALGNQLAEEIINDRNENGYFLNWSDFQERVSPRGVSQQQLREEFSIAIPVVNINTASTRELSSLPFITTALAQNIVNFRFTYGSYSSVDELLDVPDVEESSLQRVRSFLEAR